MQKTAERDWCMKVNNRWQGLDSTELMIIWEGAKKYNGAMWKREKVIEKQGGYVNGQNLDWGKQDVWCAVKPFKEMETSYVFQNSIASSHSNDISH